MYNKQLLMSMMFLVIACGGSPGAKQSQPANAPTNTTHSIKVYDTQRQTWRYFADLRELGSSTASQNSE